ncbi:MAG: DUF2269 domain-containing protein [Sideroxyarcus sp.]|nr:DUF2269 domain-containing protein [Sideroxyarcus sp.]
MSYELLKSIHIFGAILLLGNITVTAWWKGMANRTRNPLIISFAQRQVTLTDYLFTLPGAVLIVASGDFIAYVLMTDSWSIRWLTWGRVLFMASGLIWLFILIPVQIKQARLARDFAADTEIPAAYWRLNRYWYVCGIVAVLLPVGNLYWMVFKPT